MRSPFPGVDPYIEDQHYWPDFQATFLNCWRDAILEKLPAGYDARFEENVYLSHPDAETWRSERRPDIAVIETSPFGFSDRGSGTVVAEEIETETAILAHALSDPLTEVYIRITHRESQSLVTVIELLSPTNKSGDGRGQYLAKREELRKSGVNLVELDLLIEGARLTLDKPLPPAHHYALITRATNPALCHVYAWNLPRRLPTIPIPLRAPDPDLVSNLSGVCATTYERGKYERALRYDKALALPIGEPLTAWAKACVLPKPPETTEIPPS